MPDAICESDTRWSFSSPNRTTVLEEIVKKHKSEMIPDGSGVKGNLCHKHTCFVIIEDDQTRNDVIAQDGRICIDVGAAYNRPLRTDNSGSE